MMKKVISATAAAFLIAGLASAPAVAKKHHRRMQNQNAVTTGSAPSDPMMRGNNAELMGNNGTSAQGSNSLGHLQGGNNGSGR
jgi:hypothetical protein